MSTIEKLIAAVICVCIIGGLCIVLSLNAVHRELSKLQFEQLTPRKNVLAPFVSCSCKACPPKACPPVSIDDTATPELAPTERYENTRPRPYDGVTIPGSFLEDPAYLETIGKVPQLANPATQEERKRTASEYFMGALASVESEGNDEAIGDGGHAIGRYQIWRIYWLDAVQCWQGNTKESHLYVRCKEKVYAEQIVMSYLFRYAPEEARIVFTENKFDVPAMEKMARIHNGGPKGHTKTATKAYWLKVKKALEKSLD